MYKINPPKIHLSTVLGYDVEGKRYIVKDEKIFVQYVILRGSL